MQEQETKRKNLLEKHKIEIFCLETGIIYKSIEEIVEKLERQHQDDYPNYYQRIDFNLWQYGSSGYYIVPFKNKMYKVRVEDNVLKDPLYINQIVSWEEYEISLEG